VLFAGSNVFLVFWVVFVFVLFVVFVFLFWGSFSFGGVFFDSLFFCFLVLGRFIAR